MITFEQFYLMENLFFNDVEGGNTYKITYQRDNTNLNLGDTQNGQALICKFTGEYSRVKGTYTGPIAGGKNMFYIGYRSIEDLRQRTAAMATIKGTANWKRQNPRPNAGYHAYVRGGQTQQYYKKEHFTLSEQDYNNFLDRAINDFASKANPKQYGVFLYPESRSKNAEDLCTKLRNVVGADHSYIIPLSKLTVHTTNIDSIFEINTIADDIAEIFNNENIDVPLDRIQIAVKAELLSRFNKKNLSTASDTRPVHMSALVDSICARIGINPPERQLGGHLDSYTNSHYDIEAFLYDYNQHLKHPRRFAKGEQQYTYMTKIQKSNKDILDTKDKRQQEELRGIISRTRQNTRILLVDDNINSGDMYKQVRKLAEKPLFPDTHMDFFYLICKETYTTNN